MARLHRAHTRVAIDRLREKTNCCVVVDEHRRNDDVGRASDEMNPINLVHSGKRLCHFGPTPRLSV